MISKLSVRQRLLLLVIIPVIGGAINAALLFDTIKKVRVGSDLANTLSRQQELIADILPPPLFVIELFSTAGRLAAETDAQKQTTIIQDVQRIAGDFEAREKHWANQPLDPEVRTAIFTDAAIPARELITVIRQQLIPAVQKGDTKAAQALMHDRIDPLFQTHLAAVRVASELAIKTTGQITTQASESVAAAVTHSIIMAIVIGLSIIPLAYVMMRSILRPIGRLSTAMHSVADGTGDLRTKLHVGGDRSEIGQLAENFNNFLACVNGMVLKIEEMATDLGASADQISSSAAEGLRATQHQNENLRKMLDGVNDMCTSAGQIAESSRKANDAAKRTGEMAGQGDKDVAQTIEGMGRIDTTVSDGARSVGKLGERSREIGQIIAVINDIADQTNLLALNAAIEAARAGEHGRGFAVVADEVRKLAERTTAATKQVSDSIGEIQTMTAGSVESIVKGTEEVKLGITAAQSTTESLKRIVEQASTTGNLITEIATNAADQARMGENLRDGVRQVSSAAEQLESTSTLTAKSTADMAQSSRQLKQLVARFQVERRRSDYPRIALAQPIPSSLGSILDINPDGASISLHSGHKLAMGQPALLEFTALGRPFKLPATVRWISKHNNADHAGLHFEPPAPDLARLNP